MAQRTVIDVPLSSLLASAATNWAIAVSSGVVTFNKAAADETTTIYAQLRLPAELNLNPYDFKIAKIDVEYAVGVADLDAAPSAVLARITMAEATGVRTRAVETETEAFVGTNAVGLAVGTYVHTITPTAPLAHLENNEEFQLEWASNAAATSTIKIGRIRIWMAPV